MIVDTNSIGIHLVCRSFQAAISRSPKLCEGPDRGETRTGYQKALRQLQR